MVRALIVSLLVGVMCPVLGAYVITRGRAFMGDALAHSVLPGMVVAFLLGVSPFFAAVPAGIAIALLMGSVSPLYRDNRGHVHRHHLRWHVRARSRDALEGHQRQRKHRRTCCSGRCSESLEWTSSYHSDSRRWCWPGSTPSTDSSSIPHSIRWEQRSIGIRTNAVEYVLLALLALVIVIGIQAAGIVLVMAMLITPAATAYLLARRFVGVMVVGSLVGGVSAVAGLYLSFHADLPVGPRHGPGRHSPVRCGGSGQERVADEPCRPGRGCLSPRGQSERDDILGLRPSGGICR